MKTSRLTTGAILGCSVGLTTALVSLPSASAGVNECEDLIICIDITTPGGSGTGGGSGGGGNTGGGSGSTNPFPDSGAGGIAGATTGNNTTGGGGGPTAAQVAAQALAQLELRKPKVFMTPSDGNLGLVGLPVWLWIDTTDPHRWSPDGIDKTLKVGNVEVTVTAYSHSVTWDMGDGHSQTCFNPGVAYQSSDGNKNSPACGYKYTKTSAGKDGSKYTVSATVNWKAYYRDAEGRHELSDMTGASSTTARVGELQIMN
ncbi:hypothetical protein [Embleya scabrispora]|uniref:hypothetical protein n=1 Tax=Embleya scabrispora TaxID=159449 RepID=UPI001319C7C9|nr:hypothetical protein [Embleya scabrispora]MYS84197.1 hypothetical protein [Streptomyces sp. SID5474]